MSKTSDCCKPPTRRPLFWVALAVALVVTAVVTLTGRPAKTPSPAVPVVDPLVAELGAAYPIDVIASGVVHEHELVAAPATLSLLDGRSLEVWAYNGQVPGPTFRARVGDTLRVRFKNELPQPTTVHWHGVRVPNSMDGVPGVTQPPVEPGGTFTYELVLKDAGTLWFHPHVRSSEQVERGLYGVLIVEDVDPPPFTREVLWVLDDFKLDDSGQISAAFNTRHDLAHDGRWGNVVTVNGSQDPTFEVSRGERLRIRVVNVANGRVFRLDLGGLDARGIAFDGLYAREPFDPTALDLAPGNRIDLDLTISAGAAVDTLFEVSDRYLRRASRLARLRVTGAPEVAAPSFTAPSGAVPRWAAADAAPVTRALALNARRGGPYGISWMIAGVAMDHTSHDHPAHASFTLPKGAFSRLSFENESARIHPMHLHGTFFKVISRDGVPTDEPFFRDTVLVRPNERVDIGLVPVDEGTWMMHCHILEHAESGMMTLFRVE